VLITAKTPQPNLQIPNILITRHNNRESLHRRLCPFLIPSLLDLLPVTLDTQSEGVMRSCVVEVCMGAGGGEAAAVEALEADDDAFGGVLQAATTPVKSFLEISRAGV
jgi:hypothetical protein